MVDNLLLVPISQATSHLEIKMSTTKGNILTAYRCFKEARRFLDFAYILSEKMERAESAKKKKKGNRTKMLDELSHLFVL